MTDDDSEDCYYNRDLYAKCKEFRKELDKIIKEKETNPCPDCKSPSMYTGHESGLSGTFFHRYKCLSCGTRFAIGMEFGKPVRIKTVRHKLLCFKWITWEKYDDN